MCVRLSRYSDSGIHGVYSKHSVLGSRILGIIQNNDVTASSPRSLFQNSKQNGYRRQPSNVTQKRILLESGRDASPHFIVRRNERILRALFQKRGIIVLLTYGRNGYSGIIRNIFLFRNRVNRTQPKSQRRGLSIICELAQMKDPTN